jgi:N-methylhydantoinase A
MKLNKDKALDVMEKKVAALLKVSVETAAFEIKKMVDSAMGLETERLRQEMGCDEDPMLVFYGGAGPAHCCGIAEAAGLKKIVITPFSAVFSAFSSSNMDVGHLYYRRVETPLTANGDFSEVEKAVANMWKEAERDMRGEGFTHDKIVSSLELFVQSEGGDSESKLEAEADFYKDPEKIAALIDNAGATQTGDLRVSTVSLLVRAQVAHYEIKTIEKNNSDVQASQKGTRSVFMGEGYREVPVYDRGKLTHGHNITGPALVESAHTTIYVSTGWTMTIDQYNNAVLEGV